MAVLEIADTLIENVKVLLDLEDTTMYDKKLSLFIPSAISKLSIEGVKEVDSSHKNYCLYCVCISYSVAVDLNLDINLVDLYRRYITSVNTLRSDIHEQVV